MAELKYAYHEAVDDYIETCAKTGKEPQKPCSGKVMFRVKPETHRRAAVAAERAGKSLNQWAEEVLDEATKNYAEHRLSAYHAQDDSGRQGEAGGNASPIQVLP